MLAKRSQNQWSASKHLQKRGDSWNPQFVQAWFSFFLLTLSITSYARALDIPFEESRWQILEYSKLKAHDVSFKKDQLIISVQESASPVIFPLSEKGKYAKFYLKAEIQGTLDMKKRVQGEEGADDFRLRVGFVYEGERKLSLFQKMAAPSWVKTLFRLSPEGSGVDQIVFYNTYIGEHLKGTERLHPKSDLLKEKFVIPVKDGVVDSIFTLDASKNILALWVSSDGDDTKSHFQVILNKIELQP